MTDANERTAAVDEKSAEDGEGQHQEIAVEHGPDCGRAKIKSTQVVTSVANFESGLNEDAELQIEAYWSDTEDPTVQISLNNRHFYTSIRLSPKQVRALTHDLETAATHAEQGAAELRGDTDE